MSATTHISGNGSNNTTLIDSNKEANPNVINPKEPATNIGKKEIKLPLNSNQEESEERIVVENSETCFFCKNTAAPSSTSSKAYQCNTSTNNIQVLSENISENTEISSNKVSAETIGSNIGNRWEYTTKTFINNEELCKCIDEQFIAEISSLKITVNKLKEKSNEANINTIQDICNALNIINDFLMRYNTNTFGGFCRLKPTEKELIKTNKIEQEKIKEYNEIKAISEKKLTDDRLNDLMQEIQTNLNSDLAIVTQNLDTITNLMEENFSNDTEAMLNILQRNCLSAWIVNDIAPALNKVDTDLMNNLNVNKKPLQYIRELNNKARETAMFQEKPLSKMSEQGQAIVENSVFKKFMNTKIGIRGRSGKPPFATVPRIPVYNKEKEERDTIIKGEHPELKTGFIPHATASLKAVPEDLVKNLNEALKSKNENDNVAALEILNYLGTGKDGLLFQIEENQDIKYEFIPSFANIIDKKGLPTYCSVSGTTGEIICSLLGKGSETTNYQNELKNCLTEIFDVAQNYKTNSSIINNKDFSKFFAPIASFMEAGHYHTSAEVLGGFYSVAVAQKGSNMTRDNMIEGFTNLLDAFIKHQEAFFGKTA